MPRQGGGDVVVVRHGKQVSVWDRAGTPKLPDIAEIQVNCLTETFFDLAIIRAQELDAYLARTGNVVGPLQ